MSAKCPNRRSLIKVVTFGMVDAPVVFCCEVIDKDGFKQVSQRPRQQGNVSGYVLRPPTTTTTKTMTPKSSNRFMALTAADLSEIAAAVDVSDASCPLTLSCFCFSLDLFYYESREQASSLDDAGGAETRCSFWR